AVRNPGRTSEPVKKSAADSFLCGLLAIYRRDSTAVAFTQKFKKTGSIFIDGAANKCQSKSFRPHFGPDISG
ncbi:hypothetical protein OFB94_28625, partial [Escherichia coli]|nr:hypothetical protein [Escherichia coli]